MGSKIAYTWTGEADLQGRPVEFFMEIPARDLTEDDVEALTPDQRKLLKSDAGKRLYSSSRSEGGQGDSSTGAGSAGGSSRSGTSKAES